MQVANTKEMKETANLLEKESENLHSSVTGTKEKEALKTKTGVVAEVIEAESDAHPDNTRAKPAVMEGGDSTERGSGEGKGMYSRVSTEEVVGQGVATPATPSNTAGSTGLVTLSGDGVQQQQQQQNQQEQRQPGRPVVGNNVVAAGSTLSSDYVQQQQPQQQKQAVHKVTKPGKPSKSGRPHSLHIFVFPYIFL